MARSLPILALALLAACARGEPAGFATVDPDYTVAGGQWNTGGGITVAVRAFESNGRTKVCGTWTTDRQAAMTYAYNRNALGVGSIYLGGERLVQNLNFMSQTHETDNLSGVQASCVLSPVSWRAEFADAAPRVRFPRFVVPQDGGDEEGGGSGDSLVFREAPRADIIR